MVQVSLYCAIVGVPRSTFVVDIDTDRSVAHLKDAIKAKNAVDVLCDARELRLYLAKKDVVWLPDDDDLDKLIQTEGFFDGMEEMRASWELSDFVWYRRIARKQGGPRAGGASAYYASSARRGNNYGWRHLSFHANHGGERISG